MQSISLVLKAFWAPAEAMFIVSKNPRVLVPLILLSVVSLGVGIVSYVKIDFGEIVLQQLERSPRGANMSEEQKQNVVQVYRRLSPVFVVMGALFPAILVTLASLLYFAIFTMIGRDANFKAFYAVTLFAYVPLIVRQLVAAVQLFAIPSTQLDVNELGNLSIQLFLDPSSVSKAVYALAGVVDITSIWIVILLCIGYKTVVRKSVGAGLRATAVIVPYFIFSLLLAGLRMLQAG